MDHFTLSKFENRTFESQTLFLSGYAYINCIFKRCTLIVTNTPFHMEDCKIDQCNWRFEYDVPWGAAEARRVLKQLVNLIDSNKSEKLDVH